MPNIRMLAVLSLGLCILLAPIHASADAGDPDPSFGGIGRVTYSTPPDAFNTSNDSGRSILLQPDGKVLLAGPYQNNSTGGIVLLRRNDDGTPDTTFGTGGVVYTSIVNYYGSDTTILLQSDGKIVLVGANDSTWDFIVARYETDGTLDPTFGTGGIAFTDISGIDQPTDVAIQGDGKIVVAGPAQGYGYGLAVARFEANGILDTGFGTGGKYANGAIEGEMSVVIQTDGRIVVGGSLDQGCAPCGDFALLRLETNGTLDTSFGVGGIATADLAAADRIKDLVLQSDGSFLATGGVNAGFSGAGRTGVARFLSTGALDPAFGTGGTLIVDVVAGLEEGRALLIEPGGVITVAGDAGGAVLLRLTSAGVLDASFGTGGILHFAGDFTNAVVRQPDGRLVAGGSYSNDFAIWRFFNNTCGDGGTEPGEECDDNNVIDGDGCDSDCTVTACGNGIVTSGEGCDDGNTANGDGCSAVCQVEPTPTPTATPTVTPTPTRTPTPTLTTTPTPGPTPACGDAAIDAGEECDDGNLLDGDCCSSTCQLVHHPSCLDHFLCYQAKTTAGTTKFAPVTGVALVDRLGSSTVEVKAPNRLCAPTNKLGEDPTAPVHPDHLEGYPVKPGAKFAGAPNQVVTNQFGTLVLAVKKSVGLFVPTAKSLVGTPPAPVTTLDHFQCYQAKVASGAPKFAPVTGVTLQDQFGTLTVDVRKPTRFCVPTDKNGETPGAQNHPNHLVCYQVKQTSLPKFAAVTPLFTNNQFGPGTRDAKKVAELCVPSFANPVCGNGVIEPGEQCDGGACCAALCKFAPNSPCLERFAGVATNVPIDSLTGWTQCHADQYDDQKAVFLLQAACDQANLLLGCRAAGSSELLVAAHAPRTDVFFDTGTSNTPHDANDVGWYFSFSHSWGFAPQGAVIDRNVCDIEASNIQGGTDPTLRLCWHTNGNFLVGGWRCGANDFLNTSTAHERLIFEAP